MARRIRLDRLTKRQKQRRGRAKQSRLDRALYLKQRKL